MKVYMKTLMYICSASDFEFNRIKTALKNLIPVFLSAHKLFLRLNKLDEAADCLLNCVRATVDVSKIGYKMFI